MKHTPEHLMSCRSFCKHKWVSGQTLSEFARRIAKPSAEDNRKSGKNRSSLIAKAGPFWSNSMTGSSTVYFYGKLFSPWDKKGKKKKKVFFLTIACLCLTILRKS